MRRAVTLALVMLLGGACANVHIDSSTRDIDPGDAEYDLPVTDYQPDAMADRLGEPDSWTEEEVRGEQRLTLIWKCVEGEYRRMTWRASHDAREPWVLLDDVTKKGECD